LEAFRHVVEGVLFVSKNDLDRRFEFLHKAGHLVVEAPNFANQIVNGFATFFVHWFTPLGLFKQRDAATGAGTAHGFDRVSRGLHQAADSVQLAPDMCRVFAVTFKTFGFFLQGYHRPPVVAVDLTVALILALPSHWFLH
jgi:hypothetical protein